MTQVDYNSVILNFDSSIKAFQEAKKKMCEEFSDKFEEFIEAVLRENEFPAINITGWIPQFNDGDPCTFTLNIETWEFDRITEHFTNEENKEQVTSSALSFLPPDTTKAIDLSNLDNLDSQDSLTNKRAKRVEKAFEKLKEVFEDALGSYFEILAVIDANDNFHYYFNEDYEPPY